MGGIKCSRVFYNRIANYKKGFLKFLRFGSTGSLSLLVAVFLTGCAQDRDLEDFRKTQRLKERQRLSKVEGTYLGRLSSDNKPWALAEVNLKVVTKSEPTGRAGVTAEETPILQVAISGTAENIFIADFEDVTFNETTGKIYGTRVFRHPSEATQTQTFALEAQLSEGVFSGEIFEKGFENQAIQIQADKEGQSRQGLDISNSFKTQSIVFNSQKIFSYSGLIGVPYRGPQKTFFSFQSDPSNSSRGLFEKVSSNILLRLTMAPTPHLQLVFEAAVWDRNSKTLKAKTQFTGLSQGPVWVWVDCKDFDLENISSALCHYRTDHRVETASWVFDATEVTEPIKIPELFFSDFAYRITQPAPGFEATTLTLTPVNASRSRDFTELFLYETLLRANLYFSNNLSYLLDPTVYQKGDRRITSQASVNSFGKTFFVYLTCLDSDTVNPARGLPKNLRCSYQTSVTGGPLVFDFEEAPLSP